MTSNAIASDLPQPPDVAKKPHVVKAPHGAERNDEYYWLRDDTRKNPDMLAYLNSENAHTDAYMARLKPVQEQVYDEIVGRIKQDDSSVPYHERGYWYYSRFETGKDYPIHARKKDRWSPPRKCRSTSTSWRRARNTSASATGKSARTTPCSRVGGRRRPSPVRDPLPQPRDRRNLRDEIKGVSANLSGPTTTRRLLRRERSGNAAHRACEEDRGRHAGERRRAGVRGEGRQLLHGRRPHARRQVHLHPGRQHRVERGALHGQPPTRASSSRLRAPARRGIRSRPPRRPLGHPHQRRRRGKNYKIVTAPDGSTSRKDWKDWVAHRDDVFIDGFELFDGFTAIAERSEGLRAPAPAEGRRQGRIRQGRRTGLRHGPVGQRRAGHRLAALHLHVDDDAGHRTNSTRRPASAS